MTWPVSLRFGHFAVSKQKKYLFNIIVDAIAHILLSPILLVLFC
ncbi:hypothetical protein [Candidatus Endolissoclinum faulkneri]|nr:hypothetical protein [Candidatus Endolissoclinum faulkneri]